MPEEVKPTFPVFLVGEWPEDKHEKGNKHCQVGWCNGGVQWPHPCPCGGLIHASFGDENYDGDYWLFKKCDRAGEPNSEHKGEYED